MSNDPVKEIKNQIALLEKMMKDLEEINDKPNVASMRKRMVTLINTFTKAPYDFIYGKDVAKKEIYLWWGEERKKHGMQPEITIYVTGKAPLETINVLNDCLVGTLQGLYEQLQEYSAYEYKMERDARL